MLDQAQIIDVVIPDLYLQLGQSIKQTHGS
jgi:hypothetical protein